MDTLNTQLEIIAEIASNNDDQGAATKLSEVQLALVGGGMGDIVPI